MDRITLTDNDYEELVNDIFEAYREKVRRDAKRIEELENGACRFNCRTARDAFMAGFGAGFGEGFRCEENPACWKDDCIDSPEVHYQNWKDSE